MSKLQADPVYTIVSFVPDAAVGLSSSPYAVDVVRVDDNVILLAIVEVQDVVSVTFN